MPPLEVGPLEVDANTTVADSVAKIKVIRTVKLILPNLLLMVVSSLSRAFI
jgi:hypothetical protein